MKRKAFLFILVLLCVFCLEAFAETCDHFYYLDEITDEVIQQLIPSAGKSPVNLVKVKNACINCGDVLITHARVYRTEELEAQGYTLVQQLTKESEPVCDAHLYYEQHKPRSSAEDDLTEFFCVLCGRRIWLTMSSAVE